MPNKLGEERYNYLVRMLKDKFDRTFGEAAYRPTPYLVHEICDKEFGLDVVERRIKELHTEIEKLRRQAEEIRGHFDYHNHSHYLRKDSRKPDTAYFERFVVLYDECRRKQEECGRLYEEARNALFNASTLAEAKQVVDRAFSGAVTTATTNKNEEDETNE